MTDTNSLRTGAGYALRAGLYATHKAMIEAADTIDRLKNDAAIFYEAAAGLLATNDALRAQLAEAQKNEKRYLWMRDKETSEGWDIIGRSGTPDQIDAAIDAAKGESNA